MSVIDALTQGFTTIARRWWIILIPIALDVFLWLGPRISIAPIVEQVVDVIEVGAGPTLTTEMTERLALFRQVAEQVAQQYNLFSTLRLTQLAVPSLLVWGQASLGLPSAYESIWLYFLQVINLPGLRILVPDATFMTRLTWPIDDYGLLLLLNLSLWVGGALIGTVFLGQVAHSIDESQERPPFWRRWVHLIGRFVFFTILRLIVLLAIGVPFLFFLSILSMASPELALLSGLIGMGVLTWLSFYGIFFTISLALNDVSIWKAIWNSFNVVIRNFWPTLWLFALINLIGGGLTILWQQLSGGSWPTLIGIVGHAYVGVSLMAASMIFFQNRYTQWREAIAKLLAQNPHLLS